MARTKQMASTGARGGKLATSPQGRASVPAGGGPALMPGDMAEPQPEVGLGRGQAGFNPH